MMNNKTKTILAVALVGGVGYYMWMKSKKSTASFANAAGRKKGGTSCQYIEDGYLYSGRIIAGTNTCQGSGITSKGEAL